VKRLRVTLQQPFSVPTKSVRWASSGCSIYNMMRSGAIMWNMKSTSAKVFRIAAASADLGLDPSVVPTRFPGGDRVEHPDSDPAHDERISHLRSDKRPALPMTRKVGLVMIRAATCTA
jgi:hypothetical protein